MKKIFILLVIILFVNPIFNPAFAGGIGYINYDYVVENYQFAKISMREIETKEREISAFKGLDDGYKKIVITMDNNPLIQLERGYKIINIFDFLLNDNILKEI